MDLVSILELAACGGLGSSSPLRVGAASLGTRHRGRQGKKSQSALAVLCWTDGRSPTAPPRPRGRGRPFLFKSEIKISNLIASYF